MKLKLDAVLVIGGFDPTGCAGITTDIATLKNLGVKFTSLITALTAQNSSGISDFEIVPERIFRKQIENLLVDYRPAVIKAGMLPSIYQIDAILNFVKEHDVKLILDPVKSASKGGNLVEDEVYNYMTAMLFPVSYLVTPNIPEAKIIVNEKIEKVEQMIEAAIRIKKKGPRSVYVKGGHMEEDLIIDILLTDAGFTKFESKKIERFNFRGSGCKFASALAGLTAIGFEIEAACKKAKDYMDEVFIQPERFY
jgi:hydroxymethylpyrimidine/phosphomethylpyrimidine kinase